MDILPGMKIVCNGIKGTLGLFVKSRDNPADVFILSCLHVLGERDSQGEVTLPDHRNLEIATYRESSQTAYLEMDAALARVHIDPNITMNNTVVNSNWEITTPAYWRKDQKLIKFGAGTEETRCKLKRKTSRIGNLLHAIELQPVDDDDSSYCGDMDSGSIWCTTVKNYAICMHSKGGFDDNIGLAVPVNKILEHFNMDIY